MVFLLQNLHYFHYIPAENRSQTGESLNLHESNTSPDHWIFEIIQGIKAVCGKDFPVGVRFSCDEHDPFHEDSLKLSDGIEIAKCLESGSADFLDVSNGNYFCPHSENEEPYSYAQGCREAETKAIKDAVSVPVIGVSNIKSPSVAEKLLQDGACDFVGVGRQHIADPEWIRKTAEGRPEEIAHCIGCLYCVSMYPVSVQRSITL